MPNVLVTCGGRWVGLILQMRQAMRDVAMLRQGRLYVVDCDPLNPAGLFADASFPVPPVADPDYIDRLLDICIRQDVYVLVPHLDIDLDHLTRNLPRFTEVGTTVICPHPDLVELCRDKHRFETFAREEGLPFPRTYPPAALRADLFPLFVKQSRGSASAGAGVCRSLPEAHAALERCPDLIFQEWVQGAEVSVDAYVSIRGRCTVRVPRLRDRVSGGEVIQSHTIRCPVVAGLADRTIDALAQRGYRGPLNVQLFTGDVPVLIEVNARLGSGCVLANEATGGRLFRSILQEACGEVCEGDPDDYREGLHLSRYWGEVFHAGADPLRFWPPRSEGG